ncbi:MAG: hypothetical protein ACTS2F_29890, partial [Thainema sp.]
MTSLEELFCHHIDDFCQHFEAQWRRTLIEQGIRRRERQRSLSLSEIMTLLLAFHQQHYRQQSGQFLGECEESYPPCRVR